MLSSIITRPERIRRFGQKMTAAVSCISIRRITNMMNALCGRKNFLELEKQGKTRNQMAVLYRTNAQSRAVEDQMVKRGIPLSPVRRRALL